VVRWTVAVPVQSAIVSEGGNRITVRPPLPGGDPESEVRLLTARASATAAKTPTGLARPTNRLSDAPSAATQLDDHEAKFFETVRPSDLSAVFQPIVTLATGKIFAQEALVRCRLPQFSSPITLFEHAVASRATGRLGRMIREIAIPLCSGVPVFVNLHPTELEEGWLVRPDDPIFSHDHDIYLELTESVPITQFQLCVTILREVCRRASAHLVIDDLGAGYSNLKLISDLQPKVVKLDRNLVQDLDTKPRQQKLVKMVVRLCGELDATVVAEGIETAAELSAVIDSGAQYGQGYILARPAFPIPTVAWPPRAEFVKGAAKPRSR
jgi:EAL domain-containing protein (putative c-di-GMP-specific phosphodiesterase class I)